MNVFLLRCLRHNLSISWRDYITNSAILEAAGTPSVYTLLRQRHQRRIGYVRGMDKGRIHKKFLYVEPVQEKRPVDNLSSVSRT